MRRSIGVHVLVIALLMGACTSEADPAAERSTSLTTASTTSTMVVSATEDPSTTSSSSTTTAATTTTAPVEPSEGFPVSLVSEAGPVIIVDRPQRIAALSSVFIEMLFAMGAGDQVVAGDVFSNYPPDADRLETIDAFNLNLEAVIALDPDLVVLSFDPGSVVAGLAAVGIPTLQFPTATTLDGAYEQMYSLGAAAGRAGEAADLVAGIQEDIAAIVAGSDGNFAGVSYYVETDPFTFYTPNTDSFIGQLFALLGMENIADAAPDEFGSGFPQLSPEFIIAADPDVIFLASFGETPSTVASRSGWDSMSAVDRGAVVLLDPDVASRWGPRVVDLLEAITGAMAGLVQ